MLVVCLGLGINHTMCSPDNSLLFLLYCHFCPLVTQSTDHRPETLKKVDMHQRNRQNMAARRHVQVIQQPDTKDH